MSLSFTTALLCALVYWFVCWFDDYAGTALSRPIVLGPLTGLVLGDVRTGVIMGAALEAIYMGVSPIGTVMSSNTRLSTVLGIALTIKSGVEMETALALVVPIGSLMTAINPFQTTLRALTFPMFVKNAENYNMRGFRLTRILNTVVLYQGIATIVLFFAVLFGAEAVSLVLAYLPQWLLDGLNAAGGMMVVIGLALTAQSLWSKKTIYFLLLGFVLAAFLGLSTVPVAIIALVVVANIFFIRNEINEKSKTAAAASAVDDGDDFYA